MKRILVVEDESDHAELICRSLSEVEGEYVVSVAGTLSAARAVVSEATPDMALVDNRLPDGEGVAMVEFVNNAVPIVIMTAYGSEQAAVQAMRAGALDYVVKSPETLADMRHVVERAMRGWQNLIKRTNAEKSLQQSENLFRSVWAKSQDGMRLTDANGITLLANQAFCRLIGMTREQIEGQSFAAMYCEADKERLMAQYLSQYHERKLEPHLEQNFTLWDGRSIWLSVSNTLIDEDSPTPRVLSVFRDETARKADEFSRLELERKIQHTQKLESLGVLAGGIAHDFNNLLVAILGNTELALLDVPPTSDIRVPLNDVIAAAQRASHLTHQMLAYAGRAKFAIEEIDLNDLIRELTQLLRVSISKSVRLELDLASSLPRIKADASQIQQVTMNLITNASEAIGDRAGNVVISTSIRSFDVVELSKSRLSEKPVPGDFVVLEAKDDGCGMDESVQQRLFDPFFSTKFAGRGLGMSAVLGVIRGHRGAIMVQSQPGVGTTIQALFPTIGKTDQTAVDFVLKETAANARTNVDNKKFLVVDDEPPIQAMVKKLMKRIGFDVLCASNGEEAVRLVEKHTHEIDCVLLDFKMPGMDGLKTFACMRAICPEIKVILASGYDAEDTSSRFASLGFAAFLQKPFHIKNLLDEIQKICGCPR